MDSLKRHAGFVTLEIILALAILSISLSGLVLLTFGNQFLVSDTHAHREALELAKKILRESSALGKTDFSLVNPLPVQTDGIYNTELKVQTIDFFTKRISAEVSWQNATLVRQKIELVEILTDPKNTTSGDTCNSYTNGDWTHPEIKNSTTNFGNLTLDSATWYSISDIDVYKNKLYVSIDNTSANTKETFFIFDTSDPENPTLLGKLDNSPTNSSGLSAVTVASSSLGSYAYAASNISSNFVTCSEGRNCAQLQIIDIRNSSHPSLITNFLLPTSTAPFITGSGGRATGQSIFYKNGYVYLGLTKTSSGPEFNIIDVRDELNPQWVGGLNLGTTIHSIEVRGNYAYVTHKADNTPPQEQLTIIDVSNPQNPFRVSGFFYPGGILNSGKSTSIVGNTLYLGRLASKISGSHDTIPEFYALDITNNLAVSNISTKSISLNTPESLNGIVVRNTHAFFVTTSKFQVWNISNTSSTQIASLDIASGGNETPSIDCEGNYFFVSSNNTNNMGFISIISN